MICVTATLLRCPAPRSPRAPLGSHPPPAFSPPPLPAFLFPSVLPLGSAGPHPLVGRCFLLVEAWPETVLGSAFGHAAFAVVRQNHPTGRAMPPVQAVVAHCVVVGPRSRMITPGTPTVLIGLSLTRLDQLPRRQHSPGCGVGFLKDATWCPVRRNSGSSRVVRAYPEVSCRLVRATCGLRRHRSTTAPRHAAAGAERGHGTSQIGCALLNS